METIQCVGSTIQSMRRKQAKHVRYSEISVVGHFTNHFC